MTLLLVEAPDGRQTCVPLYVFNALRIENVKRGYRKTGWRVVAIYRRKALDARVIQPYDNAR